MINNAQTGPHKQRRPLLTAGQAERRNATNDGWEAFTPNRSSSPIVMGAKELMLVDHFLGLGGRTSGVPYGPHPNGVPGYPVLDATTVSRIYLGVDDASPAAQSCAAWLSTDGGASYTAIPGAIVTIAIGDRDGVATFTPFEIPALSRIVFKIHTGPISTNISARLD